MLSINLKLFTKVDLAWLHEHKSEALGSSNNSLIYQLCHVEPQFTHLYNKDRDACHALLMIVLVTIKHNHACKISLKTKKMQGK